jgi:hypothetical protein
MSTQTRLHTLPIHSSGGRRELQSLHYGAAASGKKTYIQASLHADEIPGMLVAWHLRSRLAALDAAGKIAGEIVLVPVANPVGLSQFVHNTPFGRFDLGTGINFNRGYRDLITPLKAALAGKLGSDAQENTRIARRAAGALLADSVPLQETTALKNLLQTLSHDADIVLDLHCDNEAVLHLYTGNHLVEAVEPLARLLGAHSVLTAHESGDDPFDEACGRPWAELAEFFGAAHPLLPCVSVTVELRGETEVNHAHAAADADAIIAYLIHAGHIDGSAPVLPPARCKATPLEGVERIDAPHAGIVVFLKNPGDQIEIGDAVAEVIDPWTGAATTLAATVKGILFARVARRYAYSGMSLAKIAGAIPFRSGKLLSQ